MPSITCMQCGAPLPASAAHEATTCPYCGATSSPAPEIVTHVVERLVVVTPPDAPGSSAFRCPRCASALGEARVNDTLIRGCERCGGIWLDPDAVERLRSARDPEVEDTARRMVGLVLRRIDRSPMLSCPACAVAMRRIELPGTINTLDVCDAHGTWFDGSELPQFIKAFADERAGEISPEDARAAGIPMGDAVPEEGGGIFTDLFNSLRTLVK